MNFPRDIYWNCGFLGCVGKLFEVLKGNDIALGIFLISNYGRRRDVFKVLELPNQILFSNQILLGGVTTNEGAINFVFGGCFQRELSVMFEDLDKKEIITIMIILSLMTYLDS